MTEETRKDNTRTIIRECLNIGYTPAEVMWMLEQDPDADPDVVREFKNIITYGI